MGRTVFAFCLATLGSLLLSGCGRLLDPPTPTARGEMPVMPSDTPRPTATRRATLTPIPATPSNTPTPTVTPTPMIYTIRKGDTLLEIAREFGVTVREIQEVNGIEDARRLWIGQEILIPPKAAGSEPTVAPTPTPVALKIVGLGFFRTPADSLWCLGEVVNLSDEPAEEIQVEVTLHDAQGQLLAAGVAFTQLDILAQGGRSPFGILFSAPPTSFSQYQTKVLSGVRSTHLGPRYAALAVAEKWGGPLDESNYQVRGRVENTGQAEAEKVAIVVTLYDREGHVVGARTVGIEADVFLPGAVAPFDVTLTPLGSVDHYSVEVQGWRVGYPTPEETARP
jgi:LysM repeat protein